MTTNDDAETLLRREAAKAKAARRRAAASLRDELKQLADPTTPMKRHPWLSVVAAAGAGLLVAQFVKKKSVAEPRSSPLAPARHAKTNGRLHATEIPSPDNSDVGSLSHRILAVLGFVSTVATELASIVGIVQSVQAAVSAALEPADDGNCAAESCSAPTRNGKRGAK